VRPVGPGLDLEHRRGRRLEQVAEPAADVEAHHIIING
jgi:hypothetical protein